MHIINIYYKLILNVEIQKTLSNLGTNKQEN